MQISMIAAMDLNRGIGSNGKLMWCIPEDMRHFRKMTLGRPVIMGRRTFESLAKPLNGRTNIVLSGDLGFFPKGATLARNPEDALQRARDTGAEEVVIIGGQQIYELFLPRADALYLTTVHETFPDADVFFPEISVQDWSVTDQRVIGPGIITPKITIETFERK